MSSGGDVTASNPQGVAVEWLPLACCAAEIPPTSSGPTASRPMILRRIGSPRASEAASKSAFVDRQYAVFAERVNLALGGGFFYVMKAPARSAATHATPTASSLPPGEHIYLGVIDEHTTGVSALTADN